MNADLAARRTAATAMLADFRREVRDDFASGLTTDYATWAHRIADDLGSVLQGLAEAGEVMLAKDQLAVIAGALKDAETYRMRTAAESCKDCDDDPRGTCDDHLDDLDAAQEYHDLAGELALPQAREEDLVTPDGAR